MTAAPTSPTPEPPPPGPGAPPDSLRFGTAELRPQERLLLVDGKAVLLGGRALALLQLLVTERRRTLSKAELLDRVWAGVVVEENNLQVQVSTLRRVLGAASIATVPGRGYRFMLDVAGDGAPATALPPAEAVQAPADEGNLPARAPELIGRDDDLRAVCALLGRSPLVSLVGPGGIGKTRLAQAVAHQQRQQHPDGVWLVALAAHRDPALLPALVAQALNLSLQGHRTPADDLLAALQPRRLLLVLDNCEHLLPGVCPLVARLLDEAPGVQVLATSQERLKLPGEQLLRLGPLAVPANASVPAAADCGAVRLFIARVQAVQPGFVPGLAALALVVDICRQLDGLALALELAAARVPLLGLQGVRDALGERFRLLTAGQRLAPPRHQTLQAALDWSHGLLTDGEQTVFRRLGVFAGTFTAEAAQAVVADGLLDGWAVVEHLSALVDKSLVLAEGDDVPRLRLLETTRVHALARLDQAGERAAWQRRHAQVVCNRAVQAVRRRDSAALLADMADVRQAFAWAAGPGADATLALQLATAPAVLLAVDGAVSEALDRLLAAEPLVTQPQVPPEVAARFWQWLGRLGIDGRLPAERCTAALGRAATLYRQLDRPRPLHACMRHLAEAHVGSGQLQPAREALKAAQAMEHDGWPVADVMRRLRVQALMYAQAGLLQQGLQTAGEALALAQAACISRYELVLMQDMARMRLELGDARDAALRFRDLAERARGLRGGGLTLGQAMSGLVAALTAQGEFDAAMAVAAEAVPLLRRSGSLLARADILAELLARRRQLAPAVRLVGASDRFRAGSGHRRDAVEARSRAEVLALAGRSGDPAQVQAWLSDGARAGLDELVRPLLPPQLSPAGSG